MRTDSVVELQGLLSKETPADWVTNLWVKWNNQRTPILDEWKETTEYIFATDTTTTTNRTNPWTHNATYPKLTQIRDNLHSNYLQSLFPNDRWLTWDAYTRDSAKWSTAETITSYMENKTREGGFKDTMSQLLYDYIDYGTAIAMPTFEARHAIRNDEEVVDFVGPKAVRISPYDVVFDPTASSFENTSWVIRTMTTVGRLRKMAETGPDQMFWKKALDRRETMRAAALTYSSEDWHKASQYQMDGFGSLQEYYISDTVEVLEFYGDYHNEATGELEVGRMITVVDRSVAVRDIPIPTYSGRPNIHCVGWRKRPDNLWAMSPLANLIGMQYQINHYLNMAANALDLKVMPPKKIIGDVEEFVWGPNETIHLDEGGDVQEMAQQYGDLQATLTFVAELENRMEMYAGAPREAMGIRTPGEKTAFEVQALENAAGRIFQEKVIQFELFMEKVLNGMLEEAHRNMPYTDVIRIIDDDLGVAEFREITKEDITADGILRPIGARHFSQQAQELQNLVGVFNSPIGQMVAPHTSGIEMTRFIKNVLDLRGYDMFRPNVAVEEQRQTQEAVTNAQETNIMREQTSMEELIAQAQAQQGGVAQ